MKLQFKSFLILITGLTLLDNTGGNPGWRSQRGPWIDRGEPSSGGGGSWGNRFEGPPASYGYDQQQQQPGVPGCNRCTVLQDNSSPTQGGPTGPSGPPGPGGGGGDYGGEGNNPPGYRGNGYDNYSPEWKLREVLQEQGAGAAPLGQVAAGGWKKEQSTVGMWSGTIRPIEPTYDPARVLGSEPPQLPPGSPWGSGETKGHSPWVGRGPNSRNIDQPFRVSSGIIGGGGGGGGGNGNWVQGGGGGGGGGWKRGGGSPVGPPSGTTYQGGGHGGYHNFDASRVSGPSLNVQNGFRPWSSSGWNDKTRGQGPGPAGPPHYRQGGQEQVGLKGWGSGKGYGNSWQYGRPVEPNPQAPYAPRDPDVKNPSNTDPRWDTRGPSWGFRDPPYGSEEREPGYNKKNPNWNKIASETFTVNSGYGPDPPPILKESPWGNKGGYTAGQGGGYQGGQGGGYQGGQGSQYPPRGPPPQQHPNYASKDPSYGGSGRRPGVGCRDLACGSSQNSFPRGPPQWAPPSAPQPSSGGGGNWGGSGESQRQPSWGPPPGRDPYQQPSPGAPSGYKPAHGPSQGYSPQGGPPPGQRYPQGGGYQNAPQGGGYQNAQQGAGFQPGGGPGASGYPPGQGGPGASGYPPGQGGPGASGYPPGQGGPGASGYPASQGGAGASGYPPGQGGPGASGYPPGQGGPGANRYPPHGQGSGGYQQGGPGASGYPPGQGGPGASGYPPGEGGPGASGYPPGQGGPGASGYPSGQGGPGASGYPPGQGGPGASGYPPNQRQGGPYQGGPGASGYPPGAGPNAQGGPGASGYPANNQQYGNNPPSRYNGHSGVGATLDFPGLNAYAHDTSHHGAYSHCSNVTATPAASEHSPSTSAPTSTTSS